MTLTTLKETTRDKFWSEFGADYIHHVEVDEFLDSLIDRVYHATKEEVRGVLQVELNKFKGDRDIASKLCSQILTDVLAALEDTTISPTN